MSKVVLFSHESDIDGLGNLVLAKLAFGDVDYELFPNTHALEEKFRSYIERGCLDSYDKIFITDLALYNPSLKMVASNPFLSSKVLVFDHHQAAIDAKCNVYHFSNVFTHDISGKKTCGTKLFYEYLCNNGFISSTPLLSTFVELVRLEDTWEWGAAGDLGIMAHDLSTLFNCVEKEKYVSLMCEKLSCTSETEFYFNDEESFLIANKKEEYANVMKKLFDEIECFIDDNGNKFGIVFSAYQYRNEIAEYVRTSGNVIDIKYLVIVAMDKGPYGQRSYRSIEDGFDVNEVAKKYGGGGHKAAAYVNINAKQRFIVSMLSKKEGLRFLSTSVYS